MADLSKNYPAKHAVNLVIVATILGAAVIIDNAFVEEYYWIDAIYALPIVTAAFLLRPIEVVVFSLAAILLCYSVRFAEGDPENWHISAVVGFFGLAIAITASLVRRWQERSQTARDALANSPLAYAVFRFPGYGVSTHNRAFQTMVARDKVGGMKLKDIFPADTGKKLSILMDQAVASRSQLTSDEFFLLSETGRSSYWNINVFPTRPQASSNPKSVTLIALDVTESVHRTRSREAALKISSAVMSSLDMDETIRVVLSSLAHMSGTNAGALFLIEDDQWIGKAGYGKCSDELICGLRFPYDDFEAGVEAVESKQSVVIEDINADQRHYPEKAGQLNARSMMTAPLIAGNKPIGVAALIQTNRIRGFTSDQVEFATTVGSQAALAIDNASIYETEHSMRKSLEAIEMVSEAGLASLDLEEVLKELVNRTQDVMDMEAAVIMLADEQEEFLELRASAGILVDSDDDFRVKVGAGLAGRSYKEGVPLKIDDILEHTVENCPFAENTEVRSILALPLRQEGKTIGILQMGSQRVRAFSAREWGLIQVLADRVSMALQNSLLYDETRKELARAELLKDVAAACAGSRNMKDIAGCALEAIYHQLDCRHASIFSYDGEREELVNLAFMGHPPDIQSEFRVYKLDRGTLLARAILEKRMITHENSGPLTDPERYMLKALKLDDDNRRATLPIIYKDEVVGGLALAFRDKRRFQHTELKAMESTADQLAVALSSLEMPTGSRP